MNRLQPLPYLFNSNNMVSAIVNFVLLSEVNRFVIGVDGCYGVGKTTFANSIIQFAKEFKIESLLISTDDFMRYSRKERALTQDRYLDHPGWYDIKKVYDFISIVKKSSTSEIVLENSYNHLTGERDRDLIVNISTDLKLIVLEGMYSLHEQVYPFIDLSVLLLSSEAILMDRVIRRDSSERNIDADTSKKRFSIINGNLYLNYMEDRKRVADLVIDNSIEEKLMVVSTSLRGIDTISNYFDNVTLDKEKLMWQK